MHNQSSARRFRSLRLESLESRHLMAVWLDPTFSSNGVDTFAYGSENDEAHAVVVQSSGKIVVAGITKDGTNTDMAMNRYNADGTRDTTFGDGGKMTTAIGSYSLVRSQPPRYNFIDDSYDETHALALQADGKIVAAGRTFKAAGVVTSDIALARYDANGNVDPTFGILGRGNVKANYGSNDIARAIVIQADQKIVTAGYTRGPSSFDILIARFNSDGTLDQTFGDGGFVVTDASPGENDFGLGIGILPGGVIAVAGYSDLPNGNLALTFVHYLPNGDLDERFGNDGIELHEIESIDENSRFTPNGFKIQSDGRVLLVGEYNQPETPTQFAVQRFTKNGDPDISFNRGQVKRIMPSEGGGGAFAADFQSDGKLVVVGYSDETNRDFAIMRFGLKPTITSFNVPKTGKEGTAIQLSAAAFELEPSRPADNYLWQVTGVGVRHTATTPSTSFVPVDNGTYRVRLTVRDDLGQSVVRIQNVTVANVAPKITKFLIPATARPNRNVRLTAAASDPAGARDKLTFTWVILGTNYRVTGTGPAFTWKSPPTRGEYTVRLIVEDGDVGKVARLGKIRLV